MVRVDIVKTGPPPPLRDARFGVPCGIPKGAGTGVRSATKRGTRGVTHDCNVIPAKAGIPATPDNRWTPAFAGATHNGNVIPAQAGIPVSSGNHWTPASAGVTDKLDVIPA